MRSCRLLLIATLLALALPSSAGLLNIAGSRYTPDAGSLTVQEEFDQRAAAPGVVFWHDYDNEAEVDQFRWDNGCGNDPNDTHAPNQTRWSTADGVGGTGMLELVRPAGTGPEAPEWWRPLSPLTGAGNGRGVDDPGANGTITPRSFSPTNCGSQMANFGDHGFYGHASYHAGDPGAFDGTSYFVQVYVKIDPRRIDNPEGGKLFYFTNNTDSASDQEIVTVSSNEIGGAPDQLLFYMYREISFNLEDDEPGNQRQPGNSLGNCFNTPTIDHSGCWWMPTNVWFVLLYEVIPGLDDNGDTVVRVWKAEDGETSYTKVWDQSTVDLGFDSGRPFGHNALIASGYYNSQTFVSESWHRIDKLIVSLNTIPCPTAWP